MKVTWIGHSCFKIEDNGYSIITDPYKDKAVPGIKNVREEADAAFCSHGHGDHNAEENVSLIKSNAEGFKVTEIHTYHDDAKGTLRGLNTIRIFDTGSMKFAHLGDLGCELESDQMEMLMNLDLVMIPVGGFYTIDGDQAAALIAKINPKVVIPMHFKDDKVGFGYAEIDSVATFAEHFADVKYTGKCELELDKDTNGIFVMNPKNI